MESRLLTMVSRVRHALLLFHCMHAQLCPTLCNPLDCSLPGSYPWDFSGKNTGVGCLFLLQQIFLTQRSNPHLLSLLHGRQTLHLLNHREAQPLPSLWPHSTFLFPTQALELAKYLLSESLHMQFLLSGMCFSPSPHFMRLAHSYPSGLNSNISPSSQMIPDHSLKKVSAVSVFCSIQFISHPLMAFVLMFLCLLCLPTRLYVSGKQKLG